MDLSQLFKPERDYIFQLYQIRRRRVPMTLVRNGKFKFSQDTQAYICIIN